MSVLKGIERALAHHVSAGNPTPDIIYLGHEEHAHIRKEAQEWITIPADCKNEADRAECIGLKLYKVDARNFIGFGVLPPDQT